MRFIVPVLAVVILFGPKAIAQNQFIELKLVSYSQLYNTNGARFDLSGNVQVGEQFYINADGKDDSFIYEIKLINQKWHIVNKSPLHLDGDLDLEAVDYCNGLFYLANEENGKVYTYPLSGKSQELPIDFGTETPGDWGNAGWEGLAIDCQGNVLYLVKERQPRKVFKVNLATKGIEDTFNIPETESNDFADAKFEKGFLYLLERNGNFVTKVNPETHEVIQKVSYRQTCSHENGKLYAPSKYGMAESLLLTEDEIWIGLDNNGIPASDYATKKYGMIGDAPVILRFKRPTGF